LSWIGHISASVRKFLGFGQRIYSAGFSGLCRTAAAQASTASNTVIRNSVTVNYDDTAGSAMPAVSDTIDITVSLVAQRPL